MANIELIGNREDRVVKKFQEVQKTSTLNPKLTSINEKSLKRFETLKFPHRKHEMFSFVDTKELASTDFLHRYGPESPLNPELLKDFIYSESKDSVIVIVDGRYDTALSNTSRLDKTIELKSLEEAIEDTRLNDYLLDTVDREEDVFASLNGAFLRDGLFIHVQADSQIKKPLQILHVSTGSKDSPVTTVPRVIVKLDNDAKLDLIIQSVGIDGNYFLNSVQDFILDESATLNLIRWQSDPSDSWFFSKSWITLSEGSQFKSTTASNGNRLTRHHYYARMTGEKADLSLNGISILADQEQVHNYVRVHHEAPDCISDQLFKNIIQDEGHSSIDTTVIVHENAQHTESHQLINNLLLSDDGVADTKPNLMIYADDVKCDHGATIGQISEDQLFYLKSRGLAEDEAKTLLTSSFANTVLQEIGCLSLKARLKETLLNKLGVKNV